MKNRNTIVEVRTWAKVVFSGVAIVARQSGAEPPPPGAKKAPLWRGIVAETPGAPLRGAPKRVKKGSKKGQKKNSTLAAWILGAGRPSRVHR